MAVIIHNPRPLGDKKSNKPDDLKGLIEQNKKLTEQVNTLTEVVEILISDDTKEE